jgi:hypothetical protein
MGSLLLKCVYHFDWRPCGERLILLYALADHQLFDDACTSANVQECAHHDYTYNGSIQLIRPQ